MKIQSFPGILISLFLIFFLFYIGKSFFIPLSIAIVVWYLIIAISSSIESKKISDKNISHPLAMLLSIVVLVIVFSLFMSLVNSNIGKVIELAPSYQAKFQKLSTEVMRIVGIEGTYGSREVFDSLDMSSLLLAITGMFTTIAGYMSMIIIYTLFLLLEYRMIGRKLKRIFTDRKKYDNFCETLKNIDKDIKTYLKIKTAASIATALLSYLVLFFVGVDLAVFWGLLIFLLNYIPTVGSIVAVFFPIVISLVQFESLIPFVVVTVLLITIQAIIGNVLEPKFMGKSLNLSPLVIIISLTIWGSIWGVVGMFLCVPIMVITNIILAQFERTRPISVMLSATGKLKPQRQ